MTKSPSQTSQGKQLHDDAHHILVVDDDERIRELLGSFLMKSGYRVTSACDAQEASRKLASLSFDLIVLDVMMPGETGTEFAARLRAEQNQVPIIMLTALSEPEDRIAGLEIGIDDYLCKPFVPRELQLRVDNILKRKDFPQKSKDEIRFGSLTFQIGRGVLMEGDRNIKLTDREQNILRLFASNPGRTITRLELAAQGGGSERAVDVQINRLRQKIEKDPGNPVFLQTIRGKGYILHQD